MTQRLQQSAVKPAARIAVPDRYDPDLEAHGLRMDGDQVVPITPCPDLDPARVMSSKSCVLDARLWEGRFDSNGRLQEARVTPRMGRAQVTERYRRLRETAKISEADWFSLGGYEEYAGAHESPLTSNYVPLIPGPATRQQYWADYWASSAKCFEASTHSGIAKRAVGCMVNFPLSRGVAWKFQDDNAQQAWERFWKSNRMRRRFRQIARDLAIFGEQFLRYFPARRGDPRMLIIRALDPATIYEIVADQEDVESVYFYHQQFQTRMELYSPPRGNLAPQGPTVPGTTRYIVRQIDAPEIDHYAVNVVAGEARGRSDLFPVLGDLKRLRDLLTSKVIATDIANRVAGVLTAKGTQADLNRVLGIVAPNGQPPAPGTWIALNEGTTIEPFQYNAGREVRVDFTYDEIVDSIVAGTGVSRANLGISPANGSGTTQATALTGEVSPGKVYEERQELLDEILHDMLDRVMAAAGINGEVECEFIFPELAAEDRAQKLTDLEQAEGNMWISKRTAASAAAAELDLGEYDFDEEMKEIVKEFDDADETDGTDEQTGADKPARGGKIRRPVIRATSRQAPKLDPTKAQVGDDEPAGLLVGGPAPAQQPGQPGATKAGLPADKSPAARSNPAPRKA